MAPCRDLSRFQLADFFCGSGICFGSIASLGDFFANSDDQARGDWSKLPMAPIVHQEVCSETMRMALILLSKRSCTIRIATADVSQDPGEPACQRPRPKAIARPKACVVHGYFFKSHSRSVHQKNRKVSQSLHRETKRNGYICPCTRNVYTCLPTSGRSAEPRFLFGPLSAFVQLAWRFDWSPVLITLQTI